MQSLVNVDILLYVAVLLLCSVPFIFGVTVILVNKHLILTC